MSKAGKLVKGIMKAKKESVMGKLGDSPYEDPMEPWSAKYNAPVRNEEAENLEEDGWLFRYIKSLGYNPKVMPFAQRAKYARSNAFKHYKQSHMNVNTAVQTEQTEDINEAGRPYMTVGGVRKREDDEGHGKSKIQQVVQHNVHINGKHWKAFSNKDEADRVASAVQKKYPEKRVAVHPKTFYHRVSEDVETLDEAGTGLLMSYIKSKGLDPTTMDTNKRHAYSRSSEFRIFKMRHMNKKLKETSGMGERGEDWNEEKKTVKEAVDVKDTVTMDIPLLIRVLEYAREDAKTDMDLHKVVENLIAMRGKGALSMDMYNKIVAIKEELEKLDEISQSLRDRYVKKAVTAHGSASDNARMSKDDPSLRSYHKSETEKAEKRRQGISRALDRMAKEDVEQIDELKSSTYTSYIDKVTDPKVASARGKTQTGTLKSIKAIGGVAKAIGKRALAQKKELSELKKQDDNMEIADRITREDLRQWFSKTHPEGDWKRINSKGEVVGPCAREPGEPKPKCMSKEKRAQLSKKERAAAVAAKRKHDPVADRPGKGGKPINVSNYGKGKLGEEVEQLDEKNKPTNPALWSRAKAMARSKFDVYPSAYANGWASKWYKSKGGGWKSVKEDTVQEGIYGIEDSPLSATNSVKAMESSHRAKQMKSARMIKSLYKKKLKETLYDWEKDDKGGTTPNAKIVLKGGKTLTGKDRDVVEIEPVLRTRPNSQNNK